jgi:hypothetical protein
MKPVRHSDLIKHEKEYLTKLDDKLNKLRRLRNLEHKSAGRSKFRKYHSKLIDQIKERDLIHSVEEERKREHRLHLKEKMNMYAQMAMESHRPKISLQKKEEIEDIIKRLNHKPQNILAQSH